jgi:bacillithiol biosynthesis deacetylase BshB1
MNKIDILAFGAHPDDVECAAAGVILNTTKQGGKVVFADLTQGEMGSHGTVKQRTVEAVIAAKELGVNVREQLNLPDGKITNDIKNQGKVIQLIRKYRPKIVLANAFTDRHPDHRKAAELVSDSCFLSGLKMNKTRYKRAEQQHWRPSAVYHYIQDYFIEPSFVVDISMHFQEKIKAIKAYKSQFINAKDDNPNGILGLIKQIESTNLFFGRSINVKYAEGFWSERYIGVGDLMNLL